MNSAVAFTGSSRTLPSAMPRVRASSTTANISENLAAMRLRSTRVSTSLKGEQRMSTGKVALFSRVKAR
jgi:hypothetical protein